MHEVEEAGFEVFALFDKRHVAHVLKKVYLGTGGYHGLRDGKLKGYAVVVFAIDEKHGYVEFAKEVEARRPLGHTALRRDNRFGTHFEALVLDVFHIVRHETHFGEQVLYILLISSLFSFVLA